MNHHSLICRLGPGDTATVKPSRSDSKLTEVERKHYNGYRERGITLLRALEAQREGKHAPA